MITNYEFCESYEYYLNLAAKATDCHELYLSEYSYQSATKLHNSSEDIRHIRAIRS